MIIVYTQTALKVAKVYAPAIILGGLSITAILTSNNILRKRNIALAAAYTAVDKSFKEYRGTSQWLFQTRSSLMNLSIVAGM